MAKKTRKPGRPPKGTIGRNSHPLNLRVGDPLYRGLTKAANAAHPPHSINDEARARLLGCAQLEEVSHGYFDLGEALYDARYVATVAAATSAAGDDAECWKAYAHKVPLRINLDDPSQIAAVHALVRAAVDEFLAEADLFLRKHGDPPPSDEPRKWPFGVPEEVRQASMMQDVMHRRYANKRAAILKKRSLESGEGTVVAFEGPHDKQMAENLKNRGQEQGKPKTARDAKAQSE